VSGTPARSHGAEDATYEVRGRNENRNKNKHEGAESNNYSPHQQHIGWSKQQIGTQNREKKKTGT